MESSPEIKDLKRRLAAAEALVRQSAKLNNDLRESETRHRMLIESWSQAVWETDAAGVVVADSPSWRAYTGQTLEEWLGYGWLDAIHPDDRAYAERQWRGAVAAGRVVDAEFRIRAPEGGWRWTNLRAAPTLDNRGEIVKWTVMNIDIDARKRAEPVLAESEVKYRAVLETMDEAFLINEIIRDDSGQAIDLRMLEANSSYTRQTGLGMDMVGKLGTAILPTLERFWLDTYDRVARTGVPERVENYNQDTCRWYSAHVSRVAGQDSQVAVLFDDITARKDNEAALKVAEQRQAFSLKLSDALRAEPNLDAIAYRAIGMLLEQLNLDRCYITFYRPDDDEAVFPYQLGNETVPPLPAKVRLSDFPDAYKQVLEKTFVIEDDFERRGLSEAESVNSKALGMRAMLASTIRKGERNPLSSMAAVTSRPRRWTAGEVALVEEAAERTWAAMERARDESARRLAEERALAASEAARAQVTATLESIGDAFYAVDANFCLTYVNARAEAMWGRSRETLIGRNIWAEFPKALGGVPHARHLDAMRDRRLIQFEALSPNLGRWMEASLYPDTASGGLACYFRDVTERKYAQDALRASEQRFQQFANASAAGLWIRNAETLAMEYISPAVATVYGVEPDAVLDGVEHWAALIVPDDRDVALRHLEEARQGKAVVHEFRIQRPDGGTFRWIRNTDFPLFDDNGQVQRIGGIAEDVSEAWLAVEHQGVLLAELQHRVRNIMAIIRAIAARSGERAGSVEEYAEVLAGRLLALSRVQALLTRSGNASVGLRGIVVDEVGVQAQHEGQYEIEGPKVEISPKAAEVLTLAIHELSTNALKYGALSVPHGKVTVRWAVADKEGTPWLSLDWREEGAPERPASEPDKPRRKGFGSELIEGRIPYELKGRGKLVIPPGGAQCHLEFPLQSGASVLETGAPQRATVFGGALDMTGEPDLGGRRVLVVEDDYYLATDAARALAGAGAEVLGPCSTKEEARAELREQRPDAVLLDINLGFGPDFKLAEILKDRDIPFLFITGYDEDVIPAEFEGVGRLQKPVQLRRMIGALFDLLPAA
jgi:PAS domain S-box-containing protein